MLPLARYLVSPYAGIHILRVRFDPRQEGRKLSDKLDARQLVLQIDRKSNEEKGEKKIKEKRKKLHFYPPDFSLFPCCEEAIGIEGERIGERARKRRMDDARARAPRDRRERETERGREMVNGDNEARDKRRRIIG